MGCQHKSAIQIPIVYIIHMQMRNFVSISISHISKKIYKMLHMLAEYVIQNHENYPNFEANYTLLFGNI